MRKSNRKSGRRAAQMGMGSTKALLTEPEVDAALQLIQLSGDSCHDEGMAKEEGEEESVGDTTGTGTTATADEISSSTMNLANIFADTLDDEACPPRKRKFRSMIDLYLKTKPLIKKVRGKNLARKA